MPRTMDSRNVVYRCHYHPDGDIALLLDTVTLPAYECTVESPYRAMLFFRITDGESVIFHNHDGTRGDSTDRESEARPDIRAYRRGPDGQAEIEGYSINRPTFAAAEEKRSCQSPAESS